MTASPSANRAPSPTSKSADPVRAAILAESVESPNVESARDLAFAPVGSSATVLSGGKVVAVAKTAPNLWANGSGMFSDAEVYALGVRRLSLGPVLRRSSTRESA